MIGRLRAAREQLGHLAYEVRKLNKGGAWRWGSVWFSSPFWAIASYRLNRAAYLAFGRGWSAAHVALAPVFFAVRPWAGGCDINYQADIGRGLRVLHPALGVVVSGQTVAGKNLILVGGNFIGRKEDPRNLPVRIGDNVLLGANASIIGPVTVGDDVKIGAGATVVRDAADGEVLLAPLPVAKPARERARS